MIGTNIELDKNNEEKLNKISFYNTLLCNNFTLRNVSSSYMIGISEIYSHFYYLVVKIENVEYNSPEVLNFISNALNNAGIALNDIIGVFLDEITNKKNEHITQSYILISVFLVFIILMFFLVKINYSHILYKRDSYISTFYQINLSFINISMKKCEKFLNRLNRNELITNKEDNKNDLDNSVCLSNFDDNVLSNEQMKKNGNNNPNQIKLRKGEIKRKKNKSLLITFIVFLLIVFLSLLVPIVEFNKYITNYEFMSLYLYHMLHFHNNIIINNKYT